MGLPYDRSLEPLARSLRTSMTDAERKLWSAIRRKQIHGRVFTRQKTIGRCIVDFYCASASLVIELDGGQHCTEEGREKDRQRDLALNAMGLRVTRFRRKRPGRSGARVWRFNNSVRVAESSTTSNEDCL